jgi:hypothetical protein
MMTKRELPGLGAPGAQLNLFGIEAATGDSIVNLPPCKSCGATNGVIIPGSDPHYRGIRGPCGQFRQWLPKPREA